MTSASHRSKPDQAPRIDRPPRPSHAMQMAHTLTPPSVRVQQSAHTGRRHEAHGPTAGREQ